MDLIFVVNGKADLNISRVLVLAPHTDDAEIGCGGTIARMVEEGVDVVVAAFSIASESLPQGWPEDTLKQEFLRAMPELGVYQPKLLVYEYPVRRLSEHRQEILEELVILRNRLEPDMVLLPSGQDVHQDHSVIHMEGVRAFNRSASILGYELPWNMTKFTPQYYSILTEKHLLLKWRALQAYKSQLELGRSYFSYEVIQGLARIRGLQVNAKWAESFEVHILIDRG